MGMKILNAIGTGIAYLVLAWVTISFFLFPEMGGSSLPELKEEKMLTEESIRNDRICGNIVIDHAINRAFQKHLDSVTTAIASMERNPYSPLTTLAMNSALKTTQDAVLVELKRCERWRLALQKNAAPK